MIRYAKYQSQLKGSNAFGKWYLRAVCEEMVDVDTLADHMASHNTPFSKGVIKGILIDAISCIKEMMLEGKSVKLEDLAIFKIGLVCIGANSREEAKPTNVTGVRFNAKGTGEMAVSQLKSEIRLKEQKHYVGGEPTDDEDDPSTDPDNTPSENEPTENEPTVTKYKVTFMHDGSEYAELEYAEGETVTPPEAPEGYEWVGCPTTMPARDVTVTSFQE